MRGATSSLGARRARQAEALQKTFAMTANTGYFLKMAIPDYQSLMLPVLSASLNGERRIHTDQ